MQENWKPNANQLKAAAQLARECPGSIDRLPYSPDFGPLHRKLAEAVGPLSEGQTWACLLSARKRGLVGSRCRKNKPRTRKDQR